MPDYNDCREWKEVELWKNQVYLQEHKEYSPGDIYQICYGLVMRAQEQGLQGCYLKFSSNREPYEDALGNPSVSVVGYRKLNQQEKDHIAREDRVNALAEEKGISVYEAHNLLSLVEKGVVKL